MPHWLFFFTPAAFQNRLNIKIPIEILLCNEGDDSQILYNNELGASFQSLSNTKESSLCEISCYKKRLIFNWNLRHTPMKWNKSKNQSNFYNWNSIMNGNQNVIYFWNKMCMQSINYACIKRTSKKYIADENDTLHLKILFYSLWIKTHCNIISLRPRF